MQLIKPQYKKPLQATQNLVTTVVFILIAVRISRKTTAFDVLALVMSLLSLILGAYQVTTQNVDRYLRWGSPKWYCIINAMETVLWTMIMILGMATNIKQCTSGAEKGSSNCQIFFGVSGIASIISLSETGADSLGLRQITGWMMVFFWRQWRAAVRDRSACNIAYLPSLMGRSRSVPPSWTPCYPLCFAGTSHCPRNPPRSSISASHSSLMPLGFYERIRRRSFASFRKRNTHANGDAAISHEVPLWVHGVPAEEGQVKSPPVAPPGHVLTFDGVSGSPPSLFKLGDHVEEGLLPLSPFATKRWACSMELMHHYSVSTANTLALRSDMQNVWRTVVPEMGYEHPFVLDGILAVAAIHKAHLLPLQREKYLDIAAYYQTRGLGGFRSALFYIGDTNWKPSFCFSSTIILYVCALAAHSNGEPALGTVSEVLKLFVLLRGFRSVLLPCQAEIRETQFAPLSHGIWIVEENSKDFDRDVFSNDSPLPKDIFDRLHRLTVLFRRELPEGSRRDYELAVSELRKAAVLLVLAGDNPEVGMLFFYPYAVPSSIIADIQAGSPKMVGAVVRLH
ncbi:C6 zinc finger protein [Colletotrichum higginsianum]|uniref:C6 zinc finger protein n=1 Tax=Colletotrichum higginsianum (strain IMI 349063) TaxID=759273 RepID=H1V9Q3_COLHI|nr:C6 zinc finger protein [Colletotrichum higginsianum]